MLERDISVNGSTQSLQLGPVLSELHVWICTITQNKQIRDNCFYLCIYVCPTLNEVGVLQSSLISFMVQRTGSGFGRQTRYIRPFFHSLSQTLKYPLFELLIFTVSLDSSLFSLMAPPHLTFWVEGHYRTLGLFCTSVNHKYNINFGFSFVEISCSMLAHSIIFLVQTCKSQIKHKFPFLLCRY